MAVAAECTSSAFAVLARVAQRWLCAIWTLKKKKKRKGKTVTENGTCSSFTIRCCVIHISWMWSIGKKTDLHMEAVCIYSGLWPYISTTQQLCSRNSSALCVGVYTTNTFWLTVKALLLACPDLDVLLGAHLVCEDCSCSQHDTGWCTVRGGQWSG